MGPGGPATGRGGPAADRGGGPAKAGAAAETGPGAFAAGCLAFPATAAFPSGSLGIALVAIVRPAGFALAPLVTADAEVLGGGLGSGRGFGLPGASCGDRDIAQLLDLFNSH